MCQLEVAQQFYEGLAPHGPYENNINALLERYFLPLNHAQKSEYLCALFNGLMLYNVKPEVIVQLYKSLMQLDKYDRQESVEVIIPNKTILECTGSGKKPYKTLNVSTPSIITAVASGAYIIKKGSGTTSSVIGSSDLLYGLGFNDRLKNEEKLKLLNDTGFSFIDIERVVPVFNSYYSGHFYKPHILSYILAADITSLRGNKIVYGLSAHDVMKCCQCLVYNKSCDSITVYSSSENETAFFDEIIGNGACYIARKTSNNPLPIISKIRINTPSAVSVKAASSREESIKEVLKLLKFHKKGPYLDIISNNAAFYLLEANIVDTLAEGVKIAEDCLLSGRAYKKLVEIIKCSGGRPTWND